MGKRQSTMRRAFRETLHVCLLKKNSFGCRGQRGHVYAPDRHVRSFQDSLHVASHDTRPVEKTKLVRSRSRRNAIMIFITQERTCMVATAIYTSIVPLATSTTATTVRVHGVKKRRSTRKRHPPCDAILPGTMIKYRAQCSCVLKIIRPHVTILT